MGPQDGVDLFVRAARQVADGDALARCASSPWAAEPARCPARTGALGTLSEADLDFTGRIPDADVRRILSTADVAISPDPANDFNEYCTMNKTLEYMAVGVPVVAFDLEETRVSAGEAALYAPPNEPAGLAARSWICWTIRSGASGWATSDENGSRGR